MADDVLKALLAALAGKKEEYMADDPFYGAGLLISKNPLNTEGMSPKGASTANIVKGLLGGFLTGAGTSSANKKYSNLLAGAGQAFSSEDPMAAFASDPNLKEFQPYYSIYDMERKNNQADALAEMQNDIFKAGQIEKAKIEAQEGGDGDWFKKAPTAVQTKLLQADSATKELFQLSEELAKLQSPAWKFQPKSFVSGTPENDAASKMKLLIPVVVRLSGEVGNIAEQEQARAIAATLGNWTSGSEGASQRVAEAANLYRRLALRQAERAKAQYGRGGGKGIVESLSEPLGGNSVQLEETITNLPMGDMDAAMGTPTGMRTKDNKPIYVDAQGRKFVME